MTENKDWTNDFENYIESIMADSFNTTIDLEQTVKVECQDIDGQYFASAHITGKKVDSMTSKFDDKYNALSIGGYRIINAIDRLSEAGFSLNSLSTFDRETDPLTVRVLFVS